MSYWLFFGAIIAAPFGLIIKLPLEILSVIIGLICLFSPIAAPANYVWGALAIFIIGSLPPVRALGTRAAWVISPPDPGDESILMKAKGDYIFGTVAGLIYNANWLEYAANNSPSWLIYLNWFISSIGFWFLLVLIFIGIIQKISQGIRSRKQN